MGLDGQRKRNSTQNYFGPFGNLLGSHAQRYGNREGCSGKEQKDRRFQVLHPVFSLVRRLGGAALGALVSSDHDGGRPFPCKADRALLVSGARGAFGLRLRTLRSPRDDMSQLRTLVMDDAAVRRAVVRMAAEIVEKNGGVDRLILMGVQRRGVQLAEMLRSDIERTDEVKVALGTIDITLYRDDLMTVGPLPVVGESHIPVDGVDDHAVVIVDDVLFTGRTVRAALNELADWGRPSRVDLCVLVDRGGRELPIHADVIGKTLTTLPNQTVEVLVPELDGRLAVEVVTLSPEAE